MNNKKCLYCGEIKSLDCFPKTNGYYNSYCKKCRLVYKRKIYKRKTNIIDIIDGEEWKFVKGFNGDYSVSNKGRIRSNKRTISYHNKIIQEKILTGRETKFGYLVAWLYGGSRSGHSIHRLVAEAFLENTQHKRCVNHIDCNKHNNCAENLEWVTHGENQKHAYLNGLRKSRKGIKLGKNSRTLSKLKSL